LEVESWPPLLGPSSCFIVVYKFEASSQRSSIPRQRQAVLCAVAVKAAVASCDSSLQPRTVTSGTESGAETTQKRLRHSDGKSRKVSNCVTSKTTTAASVFNGFIACCTAKKCSECQIAVKISSFVLDHLIILHLQSALDSLSLKTCRTIAKMTGAGESPIRKFANSVNSACKMQGFSF